MHNYIIGKTKLLSLEFDYEFRFHKLMKVDLKILSKQGKPKLFKGKLNVE